MFVFGMIMVILGTYLPYLIEKFSLTKFQAGKLSALLPFGMLIGSLIFGPISDRYGYKVLLLLCVLLIFISLNIINFSNDISWVFFAVFIVGFGGGAINGISNAIVSDISGENKVRRLSFLGVFFGLGALTLPLMESIILDYFPGVKLLIYIQVLLFFIFLSVVLIYFPPPKIPMGLKKEDINKLVSNKVLLLGSLILFMASSIEGLINNWLTSYLLVYKNMELSESLKYLTILLISMMLTRVVIGLINTNFNILKVLLFLYSFIIIGLLLLLNTELHLKYTFSVIFIGIGLSGTFPIILGFVGKIFQDLSATAFSIALVFALGGNMIVNYLFGYLSEMYSVMIYPFILLLLTVFMTILTRIFIANIYNVKSKK